MPDLTDIGFGAMLPQGWRIELKDIDDPIQKYERMTRVAQEAEAANFDSLWVVDHFHNAPSTGVDAMFECWTSLAALARDTQRIRLGQLVTCNSYRHPALLAKMAACVDVISHGRLILGIGAGWYQDEYEAYGLPFPKTLERLEMMGEAVALIKEMWTAEHPAFSGRYYSLREPMNEPRPVQQPHPPIWIGGMGEKITLRLVAEFADACNLYGTPEVIGRKLSILGDHCRDVGRESQSVLKTAFLTVILGDQTEIQRVTKQVERRVGSFEAGVEGNVLAGDAEHVAEKLLEYVLLGISYFILYVPHSWEGGHFARFSEQVVPLLSRSVRSMSGRVIGET